MAGAGEDDMHSTVELSNHDVYVVCGARLKAYQSIMLVMSIDKIADCKHPNKIGQILVEETDDNIHLLNSIKHRGHHWDEHKYEFTLFGRKIQLGCSNTIKFTPESNLPHDMDDRVLYKFVEYHGKEHPLYGKTVQRTTILSR